MDYDLRSLLTVGERVDIRLGAERYESNVRGVESERMVLVAQITKDDAPVFVENEREMQLVYFRESGMYFISAVMRGSIVENGITFMRIYAKSEPERHQQRNSFRLPLRAAARLRWPRNDGSGKYALVPVYTVDFSATGTQVETMVNIQLSQTVSIDFTLDGEMTLSVMAEAVRVIENDDKSGNRLVGFSFLGMSSRMQRILNKFVMDEQIKIARRNR